MALRSGVQLKLGLISFPVAVETAVEQEKEAQFNTVCDTGHPPAKIKAPRTCSSCGNQSHGDFKKARDNGDGTFTIVTDEVIEKVQATDAEKNELSLTTHPAASVADRTLPGGKAYFLVDKGGNEGYPLLVHLVKEHPEIAFCTVWAPRSKPAMYRLGTFGDTLTITELAWPEQVKQMQGTTADLNQAMVPLAEQFVGQLLTDFDPDTFKSRRTEVLADFFAKATAVEGEAGQQSTSGSAPAAPTDLMAALQAATKGTKKKKGAA